VHKERVVLQNKWKKEKKKTYLGGCATLLKICFFVCLKEVLLFSGPLSTFDLKIYELKWEK
jgi:hypothetical protein